MVMVVVTFFTAPCLGGKVRSGSDATVLSHKTPTATLVWTVGQLVAVVTRLGLKPGKDL